LRRKARWQDDSYLARIVFCELVKDREQEATTGFGIGPSVCDNSHPYVVVDIPKQQVHLREGNSPPYSSTPFAQFIELNNAQLEAL
jgi:hypothetical protein